MLSTPGQLFTSIDKVCDLSPFDWNIESDKLTKFSKYEMKGLLECSYHKPSSPIIMHKLNHCSENKLPIKKGNKFLILNVKSSWHQHLYPAMQKMDQPEEKHFNCLLW
jgi:hypothetical protein